MSDILTIECIYNQLNSIKDGNIEFKKARKIIETAYNVLEGIMKEDSDNSICLNKARNLLYEIYEKYIPESFCKEYEMAKEINSENNEINNIRLTLADLLRQEA